MAPPPFKVKAVYDYSSPHEDDLSFSNGQIITVTDEEDDDWYYGEYKNADGVEQQGLFPRNFVESYEPVAPPRPTRHARREQETPAVPAVTAQDKGNPGPELRSQEQAQLQTGPGGGNGPDGREEEDEKGHEPAHKSEPESQSEPETEAQSTPKREPEAVGRQTSVKESPAVSEPQKLKETPASKTPVPAPAPVAQSPKPAPPPVLEKPSGSSFRDRIAAFNKPAAPPVAPMKPGGFGGSGSGFIKKPFVPPPPSRNAYVPIPEKQAPAPYIARRAEEDEGLRTAPATEVAIATSPPVSSADDGEEEQPKPTSLKERIALLQRQQMEQASRHAEAAQKKEKPKRPPKKRTDPSPHPADAGDAEGQERQPRAQPTQRPPVETEDEDYNADARPPRRRSKSKEAVPPASVPRELLSDTNDADQSAGADTEDGSESTVHHAKAPQPPQPTKMQHQVEEDDEEVGKEEPEADEEEDEDEEDDVDPEVRRRLEIRERMAKMSGGMGMAGMFGPPGGLPSLGAKKPRTKSVESSKQRSEIEESTSRAPPVPIMALPGMAMPGMQKIKTPEPAENPMEVTKEPEVYGAPRTELAELEDVPEVEDVGERVGRPSISEDAAQAPAVPKDLPAPPPFASRPAPPVPTERRVPPLPPSESRPVPPPPVSALQPMSPDTGSESDDELTAADTPKHLEDVNDAAVSRASNRQPPPVPGSAPPLPVERPQGPRSPTTNRQSGSFDEMPSPKLPVKEDSQASMAKRASRVPPIPGPPPVASPPQARAPPPPPPSGAPPRRRSMDREAEADHSDSEEVTEYEGDYDTDIAAGASHKDALKSHDTSDSTDTLAEDEANYHHSGLPSIGPPPIPSGTAPRAAPPPPPPSQGPKQSRPSADMPRAAPPPPPPKQDLDDDYDPYNYESPRHGTPGTGTGGFDPVVTPRAEQGYDNYYSASQSSSDPLSRIPMAPPGPSMGSPPPPPKMSAPPRPRQSLDAPQTNLNRRSIDASRASTEHGFIAEDIDLGRASQWWAQRKMAPPALQGRHDVLLEFDESTSVRQDGVQLVAKTIYALFMDYSKTIITALFDTQDASRADLQQRHEPPPTRLRQDQLEDAHTKFGASIAEIAHAKMNTIVGNGAPFALIEDLVHSNPDALPPVGTRAYGALVYANLANATVTQNDEIRPGDIISFRNAKLQGHRGPMKQKYNVDIGKPDHVGIVVDWDGTKKKVRAWEQGRESKKVKIESFKLSDLKSGEVKVWRVMSRGWVGWGRN